MATAILWSFSLPVGSRHRLRRRSFDSRRPPHYPISVVVGTLMTSIICHRRQRPMLEAFVPLALSFLPCHQRQQWLPEGVVLAQMRMVAWALIALDTLPILGLVFDSVSKGGSSSRIACIRCQIFVYRQPSDRRPGVLPTTPYV